MTEISDGQGERTERVAQMLAVAIVAQGIIAAVVLVAHYAMKRLYKDEEGKS